MEQLVIFRINDVRFATDIQSVSEIINFIPPVKSPGQADEVEGVISLRNEIIPVVNLRKRFSMNRGESNEDQKILIIHNDQGKTGYIVDEASNVISVKPEDVDFNLDKYYMNGSESSINGLVTAGENIFFLFS